MSQWDIQFERLSMQQCRNKNYADKWFIYTRMTHNKNIIKEKHQNGEFATPGKKASNFSYIWKALNTIYKRDDAK